MFVSVLSDKPEVREQFCSSLGKKLGGGEGDEVSFYSIDVNGKTRIAAEPTLFPSKIQSLLHSLAIADFVVLIIDQLTPYAGEMIIALDLLRKEKGILVSPLALPIGGTVIEKYQKIADMGIVKAKIVEMAAEQRAEEELLALIDKAHNVSGMGNVATGIVKSGKIKKDETFFLLPEKKEVTVRTVLLDQKEAQEANAGDRFSIVCKSEVAGSGMLVPLRNSFVISNSINGRFIKSPFFKEDIEHKVHAYHNYQFVECEVSDSELMLDKPIAHQKGDRMLVIDSSNQKLRIAGIFASAW